METHAFVRRLPVAVLVLFAVLSTMPSAGRAGQSSPVSAAPRCRALAALKNPDARVHVEIMLVPVAVKRGDDGSVIGIDHEAPRADPRSPARLAADLDDFILKAKVTGSGPSAHVAVLELQTATDHPSILWPAPDAPPASDVIAADGQWHTLLWHAPDQTDQPAIFAATKPYGTEIYKAFATTEAADFAEVLSADNARAPLTPIGLIVKHAMTEASSAKATMPSQSKPDAILVQVVPGN